MSSADLNKLFPVATDSNYKDLVCEYCLKNDIDAIIPTNDREVFALSEVETIRDLTFLPSQSLVKGVQDKSSLFEIAKNASLRIPHSKSISTVDDLASSFQELLTFSDRVWLRPKKGSGSRGATWVRTVDQAIKWISLWCELQNFNFSDFQLCEFLPGRDLNIQSIWDNGRFVSGTIVERLDYFGGFNRLSGMSSTPSLAKRLDISAIDINLEQLSDTFPTPLNGSINIDLKQDSNDKYCMTEINIGRFPMIIRLHQAGLPLANSHVGLYLSKILDKKPLEACGWYQQGNSAIMYRELDNEPLIKFSS